MANKIVTLKDKANNPLYPVTLDSCVYDENNIPMNEKANIDLSNVTYPQVVADGVAKTGAGDRIIETYMSSDGLTWYRIWASGWKECGLLFSLNANSWTDIVLPITFSNKNYLALFSGGSSSKRAIGKETNKIIPFSESQDSNCMVYCCGY